MLIILGVSASYNLLFTVNYSYLKVDLSIFYQEKDGKFSDLWSLYTLIFAFRLPRSQIIIKRPMVLYQKIHTSLMLSIPLFWVYSSAFMPTK